MSYERRSTPIHRSLLEVKSTGGAEFLPVVLNVVICAIMLVGPKIIWWPVVTYLLHKLLQYLFKIDERFFEVLWKYVREGDDYDPWPRAGMSNKRPFGVGRDLPLC